MIHLGYAYELDSKTVAVEALSLGACFYSPIHKYIDDPKYTRPSPHRGMDGQRPSLFNLLDKVREDKRFDNVHHVLEEREEALLEYWNAWEIVKPTEQFEETQRAAASLLMDTARENGEYDFLFVHVLTSSHAIRILLPLVPAKFHVNLLRQWWLITLAVYIGQTRPKIGNSDSVRNYDEERDWKYVVHKALDGPHATDPHYVKSKLPSLPSYRSRLTRPSAEIIQGVC